MPVEACEGRKDTALQVLKLRGVVEAGVHDKDDYGEPPVARAAADGLAAEDLRLVLDAVSLPNKPTTNGLIQLLQAARFGQLEAAKLLIESARRRWMRLTRVDGPLSTRRLRKGSLSV